MIDFQLRIIYLLKSRSSFSFCQQSIHIYIELFFYQTQTSQEIFRFISTMSIITRLSISIKKKKREIMYVCVCVFVSIRFCLCL